MACNSFPCVPCPPKDCGPKCMTGPELACMPQCPSICPPQTCGPRFVKVQQPPKLVCQKQVVYTKRTVIDKHVMPNTKEICEPRLIYQPKVICEPCIIYKKRVVPEPKIVYYKRVVPDPKVVCQPRTIVEPKEICQTMVCQPKPQVLQIPEAKEYMCAPTGTTFYNRPGCPPVPCLPLAKPCDISPQKEFSCYDPCCPPQCMPGCPPQFMPACPPKCPPYRKC